MALNNSKTCLVFVFALFACRATFYSLMRFCIQENIPAFWSWESPSRRPEWEMAVNVDMMMNMEIMLWASANGGDPSYADAVVG